MPVNGSTSERGYGHDHQALREWWRPYVEAGEQRCREPICLELNDGRGRLIRPGTPWDLAHNRETGGYRGPAHRRCNRAEGARFRNAAVKPSGPRRWVL